MFGLFDKRAIVSDAFTQTFDRQERLRFDRIRRAWLRYEGEWEKPLAPTDLDKNGDDNTTVNLARRTVDISAFYLFGKELGFEVDGESESEAGTWLEDCWESQEDGKMPTLLEFATGAGIAGDGFMRLQEPDKAFGEQYPRIVSLDGQTVTVIWDPMDYKRVREVIIKAGGVDKTENEAVYERHRIMRENGKWVILQEESRGDRAGYAEVSREIWKYDFCPVFHTKNRPLPHSYYGVSDVEDDVLQLNDSINFVISNINRILRAHGHPQQYLTGQEVGTFDRAVGGLAVFPNPEARLHSVEMLSDLGSSFEQYKCLQEAYHELTSVPEIASGKLESVGALSGVALQILYAPLVALTTVKRMLFGQMLGQVNRALLEMGGKKVKSVRVQWPDILPKDREAEARTGGLLTDAGVSRDTVLTELGYDAVAEAEKRKKESEEGRAAFDAGRTDPPTEDEETEP
ncbi:MAG: phage portal protein [Armatimonadetes bacterium]|nr:phage portal protein [Armatimonadota bacterium]